MNMTNPQEWSGVMAKEICRNFKNGDAPREPALREMFSQWIAQIVAAENKILLDELTNLAFKETDSGKRAGYFRMARMVQARIPMPINRPSCDTVVIPLAQPKEDAAPLQAQASC